MPLQLGDLDGALSAAEAARASAPAGWGKGALRVAEVHARRGAVGEARAMLRTARETEAGVEATEEYRLVEEMLPNEG